MKHPRLALIDSSRFDAGTVRTCGMAATVKGAAHLLAAGLLMASSLIVGCTRATTHDQVLEFWAIGSEGEQVLPLVAEFERLHPDVRVEVQQIPWTAAHEKLLTAFAGDALPDVCQLGNTWVAELDALGALADLSDRAGPGKSVDPAEFFPGAWDGNTVDGRLRGVPWYVDTRLLFYRPDLLAKAGFDHPPRSWDEWLTIMRAIKQQQPQGKYAMLLPVNEWDQPIIFGMQAESELVRDGGRFGDFQGAEFRRAYDFYHAIFAEELAPNIPNTVMPNVVQEFSRGTFAFYMTGPWNIGEFQRRMPAGMEDSWATAPLPGPGGDYPGISMAGGCSLVVVSDSEKQDQAWDLIEYLVAAPQQVRFFGVTGNLPSRRSAWEAAALESDPRLAAFRTQLEHMRPLPRVPEWEQIADRVWRTGEAINNGSLSVAAGLKRLDAQVDAILAKRRWILDRQTTQLAEAK